MRSQKILLPFPFSVIVEVSSPPHSCSSPEPEFREEVLGNRSRVHKKRLLEQQQFNSEKFLIHRPASQRPKVSEGGQNLIIIIITIIINFIVLTFLRLLLLLLTVHPLDAQRLLTEWAMFCNTLPISIAHFVPVLVYFVLFRTAFIILVIIL
jgi:hypothetical protein